MVNIIVAVLFKSSVTNKFINLLIWSKPRLSKKVWLKHKELIKFSKIIVWATGCQDLRFSFELLRTRLQFIWSNSGSNFLFKYLKEVVRILIRHLAGQAVEPSKVIFVKLHPSTGLPSIIPNEIQKVILEKGALVKHRRVIVALISLLSVYRVLPTNVLAKYDSITNPFTGMYRSFDHSILKKAINRLGIHKLKLSKSRLLGSEASGPNSYKAVWGTVIDALAFIHSPKHLYWLSIWLWNNHKGFLIWFYFLLVIASPYYLVSLILGAERAELGRLATVYDQAGKARIVAITNWWIQISLGPLHDAIFAALRKLETDGTFDQIKPFEKLISKVDPGQTLHGFDLSSATDRLPVKLQSDILHLLGVDGSLWLNLLSIPWILPESHSYIKYEVGQPMGALSSWGMLAMTHHVVVQIAALESNLIKFTDYCILGDDVVIANDVVAKKYLEIMTSGLGLEISQSKSVISSRFTEFAKKLRGPNIDISPIGPGLITRSIRDRFYICRLVVELIEMNLIRFHEVVDKVMVAPKFIRRYHSLLMWTLLVQHVAVKDPVLDDPEDLMGPGSIIDWLTAGAITSVIEPVKDQIEVSLARDWEKFVREVRFFILYGWRVSQIRIGLPALSDVLFFFVSPGTYYYIGHFIRSIEKYCRKYVAFEDLNLRKLREEPFSGVYYLFELLESQPIKSIDWREKEKIKENSQLFGKIAKKIDESDLLDSLPFGDEPLPDELSSSLEDPDFLDNLMEEAMIGEGKACASYPTDLTSKSAKTDVG